MVYDASRSACRSCRAGSPRLLASFPTARSVLEVGCGTGHFTARLARKGLKVVGLDRSPAMLMEPHNRMPELPVILGDAHQLPIQRGAVDVTLFVTTIEFLRDPEAAMREARQVARQGVVLLVLNRWSLGGLLRRVGSQSRQALLSQTRDYSLVSLRTLVRRTAETRPQAIYWARTLFPARLWQVQAPIPLEDVIGMAVVLAALP